MTAGMSRLERAVRRFLAAADEPDWDRNSPELVSIAYQLVSVTYEIERLRERDALDEQIDAFCSMIGHNADSARRALAELEAGGVELSDLGFSVAQAKVHARSIRDELIAIRGGSSNLSESFTGLVHRAPSAAPRPAAVGAPVPLARPRTATPAARRAIMLAVLALPTEHRSRYREEWTAIILDRSRMQQLRLAVSVVIGAYSTRRALLESGPEPAVGDLGEDAGPP